MENIYISNDNYLIVTVILKGVKMDIKEKVELEKFKKYFSGLVITPESLPDYEKRVGYECEILRKSLIPPKQPEERSLISNIVHDISDISKDPNQKNQKNLLSGDIQGDIQLYWVAGKIPLTNLNFEVQKYFYENGVEAMVYHYCFDVGEPTIYGYRGRIFHSGVPIAKKENIK